MPGEKDLQRHPSLEVLQLYEVVSEVRSIELQCKSQALLLPAVRINQNRQAAVYELPKMCVSVMPRDAIRIANLRHVEVATPEGPLSVLQFLHLRPYRLDEASFGK